ncbi:MAG: hypothetical protein U0575_08720 [Phycisphaerales bacterium]
MFVIPMCVFACAAMLDATVQLPPRKFTEGGGWCAIQCWAVPLDGSIPTEVFFSAARYGELFRAAMDVGAADECLSEPQEDGYVVRILAIAPEGGFGNIAEGVPFYCHLLDSTDGNVTRVPDDGGGLSLLENDKPILVTFDVVPFEWAEVE